MNVQEQRNVLCHGPARRAALGALISAWAAACSDGIPSEDAPSPEAADPTEAAVAHAEKLARGAVSLMRPELHESYTRRLPDTRRVLRISTYVDGEGNKQTVAVDLAGDKIVDLSTVIAEEDRAFRARCGKLDRALCDVRTAVGEDEPIPVVIWLVHPEPDMDRGLALSDRAAHDQRLQQVIDARRKTTARVKRRFDVLLGHASFGASELAPVLAAELSRNELAVIERDPEVGQVMLGGRDAINDLAESRSGSSWTPGAWHDGTGAAVGVLELNRPDVVTLLPALTIRDPVGPIDDHARLVTAIVANTSPVAGYANDSTISIGNRMAGDNEIADIDWAIGRGTVVHNQSWHFLHERTLTELSARDRYMDYITRVYARFFSTAASNADDRYVVHKGYNILTVGSNYNNGRIVDGTVPPSETCGLPSSYVSSWRNGVPQELPHVTADGGCITAVGVTKGGTSFAAPAVTGMAAGLTEVAPSLTWWPEALKAIFLASPVTLASGSPDGCPWRYRKDASGACTLLDGRDGTGRVNGYRAELIAGAPHVAGSTSIRGHDYGYVTKASFDGTVNHFLSESHLAKGSGNCYGFGERLRVALAWDSDARCTAGLPESCTDTLDMDLDLRVYEEPGGTLIGQSATTVNSYEHVDVPIRGPFGHCTPAGQNWYYRIEVRLANHDAVSTSEGTYYGLAWSVF